MQEPPTWRGLLRKILQDPQERQRIASELGVNPVTLTRWVQNEARPRPHNLRQLLRALPQHRQMLGDLLAQEFEAFSHNLEDEWVDDLRQGIPAEFYARVLRTRATIPKMLRFLSLCALILQQALEQLDPQRLGLAIIVARCLSPSHGDKIRSLRESVGRGTTPWASELEQHAILLGAESLAGNAAISGRLIVNQNLKESGSLSPGYRGVWEESAAAAPITLEDKIAGSLLVSSTQPNYFVPLRQTLIRGYADLIALAFGPGEFYAPEHIELGVMPPQQVQQQYLSGFRQRLAEMMVRSVRNGQPLNIMQAEQLVWQQIEEEFLQQLLPREQERRTSPETKESCDVKIV